MATFKFELTQVPRSSGGVKYTCLDTITGESRPWQIYVPQKLLGGGNFPQNIWIALDTSARAEYDE